MRPLAEAMVTECGSESEKSRESARGSSHSFFFRRAPLPLLLFVHPVHLEMAVEGTEYVAHPWHDGDPGDEFPECEFFLWEEETRWLGDWLAAEGERGGGVPHTAPPAQLSLFLHPALPRTRPGLAHGRGLGVPKAGEGRSRARNGKRRRAAAALVHLIHPSPTPLASSGDAWGRRRRPPQKRPRSR
jgi:hypothetical protein